MIDFAVAWTEYAPFTVTGTGPLLPSIFNNHQYLGREIAPGLGLMVVTPRAKCEYCGRHPGESHTCQNCGAPR